MEVSGQLYPRGQNTRYPLDRGLGGSGGEEKNSQPRSSSPQPSRYTDWAIPALTYSWYGGYAQGHFYLTTSCIKSTAVHTFKLFLTLHYTSHLHGFNFVICITIHWKMQLKQHLGMSSKFQEWHTSKIYVTLKSFLRANTLSWWGGSVALLIHTPLLGKWILASMAAVKGADKMNSRWAETPCYVGPYHHGMARPRVADGGDSLKIWSVAANILNKHLRTVDKGWSSSLGVEWRANISP
jgi:hypothetical protein